MVAAKAHGLLEEFRVVRDKIVRLNRSGAELPQEGGNLPAVVGLVIHDVEEEAHKA